MGIFDSIKKTIFGKAIAAEQPGDKSATISNEKIVTSSNEATSGEPARTVDVSAVLEASSCKRAEIELEAFNRRSYEGA